jgi:hypothetical protein
MKSTTEVQVGVVLGIIGVFVMPLLSHWWFSSLPFEIPGGLLIIVGLLRIGKGLKPK